MTSIRDFVVGGSCDFCGAVVGNPHEPACPTINKEKMPDKNDRIDEAKKILKEHLENETTRKYFKNAVVPNDLLEWLIQEVEKLRSPSYHRKYMRVATPQDYVEQEKKIDSLTKEIEKLQRLVDTYDILEIDSLLRQIDSLTKERDDLSDQIYSNGGYGQQVAQLEAENADLKKWKSEWEDRYYRLEKSSLSEIASLKAQLVEAEELGKANVHWKQKEIEKLEAQLSKSQERVKELNKFAGWDDEYEESDPLSNGKDGL